MELEWTGGDPLRLADTVQKRLSKGDIEPVLDLVRFASNSMDCVVSWNHIIDHFMNLGRPSHALKIYNEVRLSFPNLSHLLTQANDMDALWGIAAKLPEKGPGAADAITYTTILGAIRQDALLAVHAMSADQIAQKREEGIVDGRRLWEDIVTKWRSGDIIIDENLVCTMGQLLLIGQRPRDWDDILSLFEQTMDIPRLARHLGDDRKAPKWLPDTPRAMREEDSAKIDPADHTRRGGEFDPVELGKTVGRGRRNMAYAKPGNHSLSLILESCLKTNARKAAEDYWHLLTGPDSWGIVPDEANLHMFLRILRQTRSSAAVVEFLRSEFGTRMGVKKPKTFRMAMSTCVRDKNNPNVFDHANVILDMMLTTLVDLDLRTLAMYTNLLTSLSRSEQVQSGLERLVPHLVNVKSMLNYGKDDGRQPLGPMDREAGLEFLSGIVSCYDRAMEQKDIPQQDYAALKARKAKVTAFITRAANKEKKKKLGTGSRHPESNQARRSQLAQGQKEDSMGQSNEEDGGEPERMEERYTFER
ncbi:hypothetical protein SLS54_004963 [Diplodia seriata]